MLYNFYYLRLLFITTFLFFLSCSHVLPHELYGKTEYGSVYRQCNLPVLYMVNKNVPNEIKKDVINAFEYWDSLTKKKLFFNMGDTDWFPGDLRSGIIVVVGMEELRLVGHERIFAYTSIEPDLISGCIFKGHIVLYKPKRDLNSSTRESIFRHEIGHVLGLIHSPYVEDLMYKSMGIRQFKGPKNLSKLELKAFNIYYK